MMQRVVCMYSTTTTHHVLMSAICVVIIDRCDAHVRQLHDSRGEEHPQLLPNIRTDRHAPSHPCHTDIMLIFRMLIIRLLLNAQQLFESVEVFEGS